MGLAFQMRWSEYRWAGKPSSIHERQINMMILVNYCHFGNSWGSMTTNMLQSLHFSIFLLQSVLLPVVCSFSQDIQWIAMVKVRTNVDQNGSFISLQDIRSHTIQLYLYVTKFSTSRSTLNSHQLVQCWSTFVFGSVFCTKYPVTQTQILLCPKYC